MTERIPVDGRYPAANVERQDRVISERELLTYLERRMNGARYRAARKGKPFTITVDDLRRMLAEQEGCCEVSGINFNFQRYEDALVKCPFAPGIDRKKPRGGYTPDNVRLVCTVVNFGMGEWGDEVLRKIAKGVVDRVPVSAPEGEDWSDRQRRKIAAAEEVARCLRARISMSKGGASLL